MTPGNPIMELGVFDVVLHILSLLVYVFYFDEVVHYAQAVCEGAVSLCLFPLALCFCVLDICIPGLADWLVDDIHIKTSAPPLRVEIWTADVDSELLTEYIEVIDDTPPRYDDAVSDDAPPPSYHDVVG
jgi:hypothetical protein